MRPLPYNSGLGKGKIGELFDLILEHLRAGQPAGAPGTLYTKTSRGVTRKVRQAAATGPVFRTLTTVREGWDAVECVDENAATVYCLKPVGFRADGATTNYSVAGMAYGQSAGGPLEYLEHKQRHELEQHGGYANAFRVLRLVKTANADALGGDYASSTDDIGAAVFHIAPFYTLIANGGTVTGTDLVAWEIEPVTINTTALTIDGAGNAEALYLDMTPRHWQPCNVLVNRAETFEDGANSRFVANFGYGGGTVLP